MAVTMEQVKELRESTGARILDCKKALEEANGDMKKAQEIVEAKGLSRAEKKEDRETKEGYIAAYTHNTGKIAALVEVACETDFVAANEEFRQMVKDIAMQVVAMNPESKEELLAQDFIKDPDKTVELLIKSTSGKIGEKMELVRFQRLEIGS